MTKRGKNKFVWVWVVLGVVALILILFAISASGKAKTADSKWLSQVESDAAANFQHIIAEKLDSAPPANNPTADEIVNFLTKDIVKPPADKLAANASKADQLTYYRNNYAANTAWKAAFATGYKKYWEWQLKTNGDTIRASEGYAKFL